MQAVLYVSHGSRVPEAIIEAKAYLKTVIGQVDVPLQEICFLEITSPSIEEGIETLINRGATKIAVVPVLLLSGTHSEQDIPEAIKQAETKYRDVSFTYGKPLGVQERIINILADRVSETGATRKKDAKILLVGRGSHRPETKKAIETTAALLQKRTNLPVATCYLAVLKPSFEEALESLAREHSELIVVPYLWFTGVLLDHIKKQAEAWTTESRKVFVSRQLGSDPAMVEALTERVYEAIQVREAVRS